MKPFAVKYPDGRRELGIGLSEKEIRDLLDGDTTVVRLDLQSVGVGFWMKEADGSRQFIQPRHSNVVLIRGDTTEEVGRFVEASLTP